MSVIDPCPWCQSYPTRANIDGEDLCQSCCDKWVRGEGEAAQEHERIFREGYKLGFSARGHPFHMPTVDDAFADAMLLKERAK